MSDRFDHHGDGDRGTTTDGVVASSLEPLEMPDELRGVAALPSEGLGLPLSEDVLQLSLLTSAFQQLKWCAHHVHSNTSR